MTERHGDNIRVIVRSRPLSAEEKAENAETLVTCNPEGREVNVAMQLGSKRGNKAYHFDNVFGQYATQDEIFQSEIQPVIHEVLEGYNCTIFAYGQTGTGKTFTMEGDIDDEDMKGIIPRSVANIFEKLENNENESEYSVRVSFLELYNEELSDLLSPTDDKKLRILEDKTKFTKGVACHNLEEIMVKNSGDIINIMRKALSKRKTGATFLNKASSRSHCIFTLTVHLKEVNADGEDLLKVGKLNLVDLAGSECIGRSGAKAQRAREAGSINQSLLTLGRVISALVERTSHIPYRDSKLTRLLQESLGGRAKTCIIATVAPSCGCIDETISTLDYASRAKSIKNKPEANQRLTKRTLIREYVDEIERLRLELVSQRAKEGVYLSEEDYNRMMSSNSSKSLQLSELEATLETRMKELAEIKELFEQTSEELGITKVKLEETDNQLTETKQVLHETEVDLEAEKVKVEETQVLVEAHQTTERKLVHHNQQLQSTVEETVDDVQQLHHKVQRKAVVEEKNQQQTSEHLRATIEMLDRLSLQTSDFGDKHSGSLTELRSHVSDVFSQSGQDIAALVAQLLGNKDGAVASTEQLTQQCAAHLQANETQLRATSGLLQTSSMEVVGALDKASDCVMVPVGALKALLVAQQEVSRRAVETVNKELEHSKQLLGNHQQKQSLTIDSLKSQVQDIQFSLEHFVSTKNAELQAFKEQLDADNRVQAEAVERQIHSLLGNLLDGSARSMAGFVEQSVVSSKDHCTSFQASLAQVDVLSSSLSTEQANFEAAHSSHMDNIATQLGVEATAMAGNLESGLSSVEEVAQQLAAHNASSKQLVEQQQAQLAAQLQKAGDLNTKYCSEFQTQSDAALLRLQEEFRHVQTVADSFADFQACSKEELEAAAASGLDETSQFVSGNTQSAAAIRGKCAAFELVNDVATGSTPSKKDYQYQKEIAVTSPHENILQRYRGQKELGEVPRLRIEVDSPAPLVDEAVAAAVEDTADKDKAMKPPLAKVPISVNASADKEPVVLSEKTAAVNNIFATPAKATKLKSSRMIKRTLSQSTACSTSSVSSKTHANDENLHLSEAEVMGMKVTDLRTKLSQLNISQVGNKKVLQQRLLDALAL